MELLGSYWLRRALARLASLTVYEGQDTRTGMPVMVLVGAKGEPVEAEGSLKVLDRLEDALVLEWPLGAVPLSQYAGVADPDRLAHWVREIAKRLAALEAQGIRYAPRAELVLVKGRSVWLVGPGLEALAGEAASALLELARLLAGPRWEEFPLRDVLARLARGEVGLEALWAPPPEEAPAPEAAKEKEAEARRLPVEVEAAEASPPASPGPPREEPTPSRPRVIRIEEPEDPPFPVVEPRSSRGGRRAVGLVLFLLLLLGVAGAYMGLFRPQGGAARDYPMEFRTDPPTEKALVYVLEAPEGAGLEPGSLLLEAPGRVRFPVPGVYRLRLQVPGRAPVDYLLAVPGPPLTLTVR